MTLEELLARAAARIRRLSPSEALAAMERGALLIDIRSEDSRRREGFVPGSLHFPRTVLEWRVAPDSPWRDERVGAGAELVVICDEGYSSILAAATLVELGFTGAADVAGGYRRWQREGLPTASD